VAEGLGSMQELGTVILSSQKLHIVFITQVCYF